METIEATLRLLYNEEAQNLVINNVLKILRNKGYYGINVTFSYIDSNNYQLYNNYLSKIATQLNKEGFLVFVTISPREIFNINEITIDKINYSEIGRIADGVNLINYDYSVNFGTPSLQTTTFIGNELTNYAKTIIPAEKIYTGLSVIAYDWPLPYEVGVTRANSMSANAAIALAADTGSPILYDDWAESAFFNYQNKAGVPIQHLVWFKDARSVDTRANQVLINDFKGISIWNLMYFFAQMWLVINSQYDIKTLL
jgi:spore germination protein